MIAISYRRDDSLPVVGRVYDRLVNEFGEGNIFIDFDSIPYGTDFREHIKHSLENAEVLVVVIGPEWFGKSEKAVSRIHEPNDFVRLELAEALKHKIPLMPVLLDDTRMPNAASLPEEIQALSFRNALTLDTGIDFNHHVNRLISGIKKLSGAKVAGSKRRENRRLQMSGLNRRRILISAALLTILLGGGAAWYRQSYPAAESSGSTAETALVRATKEQPFKNSLSMKFVPVPIRDGPTNGMPVLFSTVETRVRDFAQFVEQEGHDMTDYGEEAFTVESDGEAGFAWKQAGGSWRDPHFPPETPQSDEHPVVCVSWLDARAFCRWLTEREQRSGRLPPDWSYRLPSDHEWSCAVGIGEYEDASKSPLAKNKNMERVYPWGREWPPPQGAGNYAGEESRIGALRDWKFLKGYRDGAPRTAPVGQYLANKFGIYDLGGNVWEWCEDKYTPEEGWRVLRGAAWGDDRGRPERLFSSYRAELSPEGRRDFIGFRVVLAGSSPVR